MANRQTTFRLGNTLYCTMRCSCSLAGKAWSKSALMSLSSNCSMGTSIWGGSNSTSAWLMSEVTSPSLLKAVRRLTAMAMPAFTM